MSRVLAVRASAPTDAAHVLKLPTSHVPLCRRFAAQARRAKQQTSKYTDSAADDDVEALEPMAPDAHP